MHNWPLTKYSEIIAAVREFDEHKYAGTRNFIDGNVSYLSPYISRGCISTKVVFLEIIKKNPKAVKEKFVQELLWRDYFQRLLQAKPDLHQVPIREAKNKISNDEMPEAVYNAATGIVAIDKAILTLYESGYMHNHNRMYVAAVCCNIGKYAFQKPAKWLYYNLLDADIASNFASWQWVAGHLTWKTYIANQENINRYSREVQEGSFLDKTYEELEHMDVPPVLSKGINPHLHTNLPTTKIPMLDENPVLLYTFYNMDPEWHSDKNYNRVLIFEPSHFGEYPVSEKVLNFTLELSENIAGIQIFSGEFSELTNAYPHNQFIVKEHPILTFADATVEERDWIVPEVTGYFQSFSKYFLKCLPYLNAE